MVRRWWFRLNDLPELRGLPRRRRRRLWSEAVTRSSPPRRLLAQLVARMAGAAAVLWLLRSHPFWLGLVPALLASMLVGLALDGWIMAPVARRWLREHAHELDRYVSG